MITIRIVGIGIKGFVDYAILLSDYTGLKVITLIGIVRIGIIGFLD